jgi:hypothetical protein
MASLRFREIETIGVTKIPTRGPLLLLSTFIDPTIMRLIGNLTGRRPDAAYRLEAQPLQNEHRFLATSLLTTSLPVPLPMRLDEEGFGKKLQQAMEASRALYLVCLDSQALEFLSEMILEAEAANGYRLGIAVIVIEPRLSRPVLIRRDLRLRFRPLDNMPIYLQRHAESNLEAVTGLSQLLTSALFFSTPAVQQGLLRNKPFTKEVVAQKIHDQRPIWGDLHDEIFLERLARLQTLELDDNAEPPRIAIEKLRSQLEPLLRQVLPSTEVSRTHDPLRQLRTDMRGLWFILYHLKIHDRGFYINEDLGVVRKTIVKKLFLMLPMIPFGIWGLMNHYLIYKIPDWIEFWGNRSIQQPNRLRLLVAPLFYLVQYFVVDSLWGSTFSLFYLLTLPIFGLAGLVLIENRSLIWDCLRALKFLAREPAIKTELLNRRWTILEELAKLTGQEGQEENVQSLTR